MDYSMSPISDEDRESIMDIFNYYVENSFAAYPETKFLYEAFDMFLQMSHGYPTEKQQFCISCQECCKGCWYLEPCEGCSIYPYRPLYCSGT